MNLQRLFDIRRWQRSRRRTLEEIDEEFDFHLEQRAFDSQVEGMEPAEARRDAGRRFGDTRRFREQGEKVLTGHERSRARASLVAGLARDFRVAMRGLFRAPGFTLITVGTLALGIGVVAAIFTVVNGVLLKPLPFEDPEELVAVWHARGGAGNVGLSTAMGLAYREENRFFEDIGFWDNRQVSVTGLAEPEQLFAARVTAGLLPVLRVQPVIGRRFTEEDDSPGAPLTAMLSYAYWQRQFAADPSVIGSTLRVDGTPREIIGVLPSDLVLPRGEASIYIPLQWDRTNLAPVWGYQSIARLLPDATLEQAHDDVGRMLPMVPELFPGAFFSLSTIERTQLGPNLRPLHQDFVGDVGNVLWVLLGTVGIVLLIACANVSNLFLVRTEGRLQEVAVRTAMGAGPGQIARQLLLESLVLGVLGGLAGLGLALGGVRLLIWMGPASLPRLNEISLDPTVLAFTVGVSLLSGLFFGLFAVFRISGLDLVASLKGGGRGGSAGKERHRARNTLAVAQVALALVLLAGSGLMIRSFQALRNVDPGFANPEEVLTFRVAIPTAEIEEEAGVALAYEDIWRRLQEIPGVTSVGASSSVTMGGGGGFSSPLLVEDFPITRGLSGHALAQALPSRRFKWVTEGYFETMQNRVLAGRAIEWSDIRERAPVAMVTANLAEEYWGSPEAALGKRIDRTGPTPTWREIVGVVGNVHDIGVSQAAPPVVFWPLAMMNFFDGTRERYVPSPDQVYAYRSMAFAIRTSRPEVIALVPEVQAAVWAVNGNLPLADIRTLDEIFDRSRSMARTSFTLVMLAISAAVALALSVVGIFGVISYIVSQRTREIGVRMAIGADGRDVRRMVLKQGMILAGIGVAVGLGAAVGLTRLMSSLLFGVEATDPLTFGAVAAVLTAAALVASYLPALRASRTDPIEALRSE